MEILDRVWGGGDGVKWNGVRAFMGECGPSGENDALARARERCVVGFVGHGAGEPESLFGFGQVPRPPVRYNKDDGVCSHRLGTPRTGGQTVRRCVVGIRYGNRGDQHAFAFIIA